MNLFVGQVLSIRPGETGPIGCVEVRGARLAVALDLVPEASVGDSVLVHAGVALSIMREEPAAEEETPCA